MKKLILIKYNNMVAIFIYKDPYLKLTYSTFYSDYSSSLYPSTTFLPYSGRIYLSRINSAHIIINKNFILLKKELLMYTPIVDEDGEWKIEYNAQG